MVNKNDKSYLSWLYAFTMFYFETKKLQIKINF